jgi:hypothetical protein
MTGSGSAAMATLLTAAALAAAVMALARLMKFLRETM